MTEEELEIQIALGSFDVVGYAKTFVQKLIIREDKTSLEDLKKFSTRALGKLHTLLCNEMQNFDFDTVAFRCTEVFKSCLNNEINRRAEKYDKKRI